MYPTPLQAALALEHQPAASRRAVEIFREEAQYLVENRRPDVLICVPPDDLFAVLDVHAWGGDTSGTLDDVQGFESSKEAGHEHAAAQPWLDFHDLLKATCLDLGVPLQLVRPSTYGETRRVSQTV